RAGTIDVDYINGLTAEFQRMYTLNANIERLVSQHVFTNNVKALSIDAIYANLRKVDSEIMTSNIIKSNWLKVDTALFNRFTSSEAFINRLVVKAANVRDLEAITVDAVQANITTVMNSMGRVEGGLTIRRPDGAVAIQNGMLRNEYVVNAYNPHFMTATPHGLNAFFQSGEWWVTSRKIVQDAGKLRFNAYQFVHSARYLEIEIGYRRHQTDVFFEIDSFGSYSFNEKFSQFKSGGGSTEYKVMRVDLGVPDYRRKSFYFYAYPSSSGAGGDQMWFR